MPDACDIDRDYPGKPRTDAPDRAIAALAGRQHGVVCRRQPVDICSADAVDRRIAAGRLHLLHRGVYAVGHRALRPQAYWMAAVLACGTDAVLSHRSAAALWGLRPSARRNVDVTVPCGRRAGRPRLDIHRTRRLHAADAAVRDGIPVTSLARTLLDIAAILPAYALARACEQAEILRLFDMVAVDALLARQPRRAGAPALRAALAEHREPEITRSDLEARLRVICSDAGIPAPSLNARMTLGDGSTIEVDALWRSQRLIVEVDGWSTHGTRAAFERDRRRDAELQASGLRVVRITYRQLTREPGRLAARLHRLLGSPT